MILHGVKVPRPPAGGSPAFRHDPCRHCDRRCFSAPCVLLLSEDGGPLTLDLRGFLRSSITSQLIADAPQCIASRRVRCRHCDLGRSCPALRLMFYTRPQTRNPLYVMPLLIISELLVSPPLTSEASSLLFSVVWT